MITSNDNFLPSVAMSPCGKEHTKSILQGLGWVLHINIEGQRK